MKKWFWRPFKRTSFKHHGYYGQSTPPCIDTERDVVFSCVLVHCQAPGPRPSDIAWSAFQYRVGPYSLIEE